MSVARGIAYTLFSKECWDAPIVCLLGDTYIIIKSQNQVWLAKHKATQTLCFSLHKAALDCVFSPTNPLPLTAKIHLKREKKERKKMVPQFLGQWNGQACPWKYPTHLFYYLVNWDHHPAQQIPPVCTHRSAVIPPAKKDASSVSLLQTVGSFWRTTLTILPYERCAGNLATSNFKHKQTWLPQV